jgi:O-antigen/teichoic acid export membrane protein
MSKKTYKKLAKNSLIFAIGEIGSKGVTLLLVPLYTFFLTTSEYGTVDILQITINLLIPIVSLSIFEAALRYVLDDNSDVSEVFTNCSFITFISSFITIIIFILIDLLWLNNEYNYYILTILILQLFQSLYTQFLRGIGKVILYALNGLLIALLTASMNLILIVWLGYGIEGYLFSIIIALICSLIFINLRVNTFKYIKFGKLNIELSKELLKYSLPLMPNSIMWWVINAASRYFILIFVGASYNGLFAVASKVPSILSICNSIFFKAWQLSAVEEYNSKTKSIFYGNVFNLLQQFLFIITSILLLSLKFIFEVAISHEFYNSWRYVPFLLVAAVFSSFSSFLGTNYIASKETNGVFKTSLIGGVTNLVLNLVTIPLVGVIGACISSMISFIVITILRWYDTKKFVQISYNYYNILINISLIAIQIIILYLSSSKLGYLIQLVLFLTIMLNNKKIIMLIINVFKKLISNKKINNA